MCCIRVHGVQHLRSTIPIHLLRLKWHGILRRVISCWNATDPMKRRKDTDSQIIWLGFVEELVFKAFIFVKSIFLYVCTSSWTNAGITYIFVVDSAIVILDCLLPRAYHPVFSLDLGNMNPVRSFLLFGPAVFFFQANVWIPWISHNFGSFGK